MKLLVLSDLHNEFKQPYDAPAHAHAWSTADGIVLAGDVGKGCDGIRWVRQAFGSKPIIYVLGNHEYYRHDWRKLIPEAREVAREHAVHLLEDDVLVMDGVRFLGCTLWTDFELFGATEQQGCMRASQTFLNDYRLVKSGPPRWRFTPAQTRVRHLASRAWLEEQLATGDPDRTVVVTHHFPDRGSLAPQFARDPASAGYGSQLPPAMLAGARLWIHGHTHVSCDYTLQYRDEGRLRETRVVCNPQGYPLSGKNWRFENGSFNPELMLEV